MSPLTIRLGPPLGGTGPWTGTGDVADAFSLGHWQLPRFAATSGGHYGKFHTDIAAFTSLNQPLGTDGQTVYISFLFDETFTSWSGLSLFSGNDEKLFFGKGFQQTYQGAISSEGYPSRVAPVYVPPDPAPDGASADWLIYRLDFRAGFVRIRLYRNPYLAEGEPDVSDIGDLFIPFSHALDRLRLAYGRSGFSSGSYWDEIRIAHTWRAAVPVVDDSIRISVSDARLVEGNEGERELQFVVSLTDFPFLADVEVDYETSDGTAVVGEDYVSSSGTLVIPTSANKGIITVLLNGDQKEEPDETFSLQLSNPIGANLDVSSATGTILNDDSPDGWLVSRGGGPEGNGGTQISSFYVALKEARNETVSVDWSTADGTATAGSDYLPASGTVTLQPGEIWMPVEVTVIGDSIPEPHEHFLINLSNSSGPQIVSGQSSIHVADDDTSRSTGDWSTRAKEGEEIPGHPGRYWSDLSSDLLSLNQFGDLAFEAVTSDNLDEALETAIWFCRNGDFSKIAAVGDSGEAPLDDYQFSSFTDLTVTDARNVFFGANLERGSATLSLSVSAGKQKGKRKISHLLLGQDYIHAIVEHTYGDQIRYFTTRLGMLPIVPDQIRATAECIVIRGISDQHLMMLDSVYLNTDAGETSLSPEDFTEPGAEDVDVLDKNANGIIARFRGSSGTKSAARLKRGSVFRKGGNSSNWSSLMVLGAVKEGLRITGIVRAYACPFGVDILDIDLERDQSILNTNRMSFPGLAEIRPGQTNGWVLIKCPEPDELGYDRVDCSAGFLSFQNILDLVGEAVRQFVVNGQGTERVVAQEGVNGVDAIGNSTLAPGTAALELTAGTRYYVNLIMIEGEAGATNTVMFPLEPDAGRAYFDRREPGSSETAAWVRDSVTGRRSLGTIFLSHILPGAQFLDHGDAPNDGLSHHFPTAQHDLTHPGPMLGISVDGESPPLDWEDSLAVGDDVNFGVPLSATFTGDDEDGVVQVGDLLPGENGTVEISSISAGGLLDAWIDFDGNGLWDQPDERIASGRIVNLGINAIDFPVPTNAVNGNVVARFRVSTSGNLTPGMNATDGEVEDHLLVLGTQPESIPAYRIWQNELFLVLPHRGAELKRGSDVDNQGDPVDEFDGNSPYRHGLQKDGRLFFRAVYPF